MNPTKPTVVTVKKNANKVRVVLRDVGRGVSKSFTLHDADLNQVASDLRAVYADEPGQTKTTQQTS